MGVLHFFSPFIPNKHSQGGFCFRFEDGPSKFIHYLNVLFKLYISHVPDFFQRHSQNIFQLAIVFSFFALISLCTYFYGCSLFMCTKNFTSELKVLLLFQHFSYLFKMLLSICFWKFFLYFSVNWSHLNT